MHDNPEIVGHTFPKAMPPINIQAEFMVAGLVPVSVFESCYVMLTENNTSEQYHTRLIIAYLM